MIEQQEISAFLKTIKGFKALSAQTQESLRQHIEVRKYSPGKDIIKQGAMGEAMYIIYEGKAAVIKSEDGKDDTLLATLGPGDVVGEMAILTREPRFATVMAMDTATCLIIRQEIVHELMKAHLEFSKFLTEILRERLKKHTITIRKYTLDKVLGEGAMAIVHKSWDPVLERNTAIKVLHHIYAGEPGIEAKFLEEARIIARFDHPNIVKVFDIEKAYCTWFIIMELVEGCNLEYFMKKKRRLPYPEIMRLLLQIAQALQYAHSRGIVHRDIKPSNCMISFTPLGVVVKLMDFGLALDIQQSQHNLGHPAGTPYYMSPESARGDKIDFRADIYSLGVMAYELVCGKRPFRGECLDDVLKKQIKETAPEILQLVPDCPKGLAAFIDGAMIKDTAKRLCDWPEIMKCLDYDRSIEEKALGAYQRLSLLKLKGKGRVSLYKALLKTLEYLLPEHLISLWMISDLDANFALPLDLRQHLAGLFQMQKPQPAPDKIEDIIKAQEKAAATNGRTLPKVLVYAGSAGIKDDGSKTLPADLLKRGIVSLKDRSFLSITTVTGKGFRMDKISARNQKRHILVPISMAEDAPALLDDDASALEVAQYLKILDAGHVKPAKGVAGVVQVFIKEDAKWDQAQLKGLQIFLRFTAGLLLQASVDIEKAIDLETLAVSIQSALERGDETSLLAITSNAKNRIEVLDVVNTFKSKIEEIKGAGCALLELPKIQSPQKNSTLNP